MVCLINRCAIDNTLTQNNLNSSILTYFQTQLPVADMFRHSNLSAKDSLICCVLFEPPKPYYLIALATKCQQGNSRGFTFVHRRNVYVCSNRKYKYFAISEEKNRAPLKLFKRSQPQMGLRSLAKTFHWSLSV